MIYRLILTAILIAGSAVLISFIPYEFEVSFSKNWESYRVEVRFRLLRGWAGLCWGPQVYEWCLDQDEDNNGFLDTLIINLNNLKNLPFSFSKKLELLDTLGMILENSRIKELRWYTEVGLKDPAATAVFSGILWALKGWFCTGILSTMDSLTTGRNRKVVWGVQPNFLKPGCRVDFACSLGGRIWGIVNPTMHFLWGVIIQELKKLMIDHLFQKRRKEKLAIF